MKKVLVFGGISYNTMIELPRFPDGNPETLEAVSYHEAIGSTGYGKIMALKRLGIKAKFHGVAGNDEYGEKIKQKLEDEGIDYYLDICGTETERHVNLMDNKNGRRISMFLTAPGEDVLLSNGAIEKMVQESDIVFLNIAPYCRKYIGMIKKYEKEIWCDLHSYDGKSSYYHDFIECADVIMMSSERNGGYKNTMAEMAAKGKKIVITTHGGDGATALLPGKEWIEQPALKYPVVDTNGAGDNFFSAFLYGYINGYSVEKSMKLGAIAGGLAVTVKEIVSYELSAEKLEKIYGEI